MLYLIWGTLTIQYGDEQTYNIIDWTFNNLKLVYTRALICNRHKDN